MKERSTWLASAMIAAAFSMLNPALDVIAEERPFSVEVMVKAEGLGEVLFDSHGNRLLVEKLFEYERKREFASEALWERDRAMLMTLGADQKALHPISSSDRMWLASYSPSGAKAAVGWFDGDIARAGVYEFASDKLLKFDFPVGNRGACAFDCPFWISEDEFVHLSVPKTSEERLTRPMAYALEQASRLAEQSWQGREPAVTVYGKSANQKGLADVYGGTLLLVNARTGKSAELGSGYYRQFALAPDRSRLAAVREVGDLDVAGLDVSFTVDSTKVLELVVYDFSKGSVALLPCERCNVTRDSLRWSPSGSKLFFAARVQNGRQQVNEHYIYDFARSRLERFAPKDVEFETLEELSVAGYLSPFVWLTDDTAAVRVTKTVDEAREAFEWYAVFPHQPAVALTAGFGSSETAASLRDYVGVRRGKLLMMVDGDLWQISSDGKRENLTSHIDESLSPWCSVISYWREAGRAPVCSGLHPDSVNKTTRSLDREALERGWMAFRVLSDEVFTGEVLFLNVDSGQVIRLSPPDPRAELVTVSVSTGTAVYRRKDDDGDRVVLVSRGGKRRELLHINRHLAGVAGGRPVLLARQEPKESKPRNDWLLLPPHHKPGDRHPLLIYFYPDESHGSEFRGHDIRDVSFLNMHIPAARGYAVLFASTAISSMENPGNPMTELHEQLIRAAQNAVAQGYVDPERWAIMGHSYGGYGTTSVVTQTNRFKAAVSLAGVANLTSTYGLMAPVMKTTPIGDLPQGMTWLERGQGRMGVAPWQDPQRYIANSPLFHAHKVETPLLLIHGEFDFVNVAEPEQMYYALYRQGKDVQFLRYWGEGHNINSPANIRDMWERIFAWLDKFLQLSRDASGNLVSGMQNCNVHCERRDFAT